MMSQSYLVSAIRRLTLLVLSLLILLGAKNVWAQGSSTFNPQVRVQLGPPTSGSSGAASALAAPSTESFESFLRYPVEAGSFTQMNGTPPAAYYRDEFVGGDTFTSGANDGDTIYAQLFASNGTPIITWGSIVFHSTYVFNGQTLQDCWVAPGVQPLCGSNSIDVLWYYQSQCNDGNFSQQFYLNGAAIAANPFPFTVRPQIEESYVPNYSQVKTTAGDLEAGSPNFAYDSVCRYLDASGVVIQGSDHICQSLPNETPAYIKALGCYLSDAANILAYHGITADPATLNTALSGMQNNPLGYLPVGNVNPDGLIGYAGGEDFLSFIGTSKANLNSNICHYGPQIMGVKCKPKQTGRVGATHWVTVYGMDAGKTTWLIHDPGSSVSGTGSNGGFGGATGTLKDLYADKFCEVRTYSGREFVVFTQSGLRIPFHSPVELLITDPQGRRLGDDPIALTSYDEIPDAYYDSLGLEDDDTGVDPSDPAKDLYIPRAASGQYILTVTGLDTSAYSAEFIALDSNGAKSEQDLRNIPIGLNEVQTFTINYSSNPGSTIQLTGGFDGEGQNPASVNTFLSYAKPNSSRTTLPTGTQSYTIVIFYSNSVMPGTFSGTLNGSNVTSMFHPQPGTSEAVSIALQPGRNLLDLQIQGNLPSRVATDTDRLVFNVQ